MSTTTILTDTATGQRYDYDNLIDQHRLEGCSEGVAFAVKYLRNEATKLFEADRTEAAIEMRNLATRMSETVGPEVKAAAVNHAQLHPYLLPVSPKTKSTTPKPKST